MNVPGIVGLGAAAEICRRRARVGVDPPLDASRPPAQRHPADLGNVRVNGPLDDRRLPHNLHVTFEDVEGERLLMALGDLAVSTGSACSSGSQKASHVVEAATPPPQKAGAIIRFGLGRWTTEEKSIPPRRVVKVIRSLRDGDRIELVQAGSSDPAAGDSYDRNTHHGRA